NFRRGLPSVIVAAQKAGDMIEHVQKSQIERFAVSALPEQELLTVGEHLADCRACDHVLRETLGNQRGTESIQFTLAPEFWFRHDHLEYEQLAGFADDTFDTTEREILKVHLSGCESCRGDLQSLLAFRKLIEPELQVGYSPQHEAKTSHRPPSKRKLFS